MREYKFRGKEIDTGKWVYGGLFKEPAPPQCFEKTLEDKYWIVYPNPRYMPDWNLPYQMLRTDVNKETVGQFTGLHDKNGKEIYEGDILQMDIERAWVMWNEKYGYFELVPIGDYYFDSPVIGQAIEYTDATVIGNIYENKELLNETNR